MSILEECAGAAPGPPVDLLPPPPPPPTELAALAGLPSCSEARSLRLQHAQARGLDTDDQLAGQMKRAATELMSHPYRVHDLASAQRIKYCGPAMARVRDRAVLRQAS